METEALKKNIEDYKNQRDFIASRLAQEEVDIGHTKKQIATLDGLIANCEAELAEPKLKNWDFGPAVNAPAFICINEAVHYGHNDAVPFTETLRRKKDIKGNLKELLEQIKGGGCIVGFTDDELHHLVTAYHSSECEACAELRAKLKAAECVK